MYLKLVWVRIEEPLFPTWGLKMIDYKINSFLSKTFGYVNISLLKCLRVEIYIYISPYIFLYVARDKIIHVYKIMSYSVHNFFST